MTLGSREISAFLTIYQQRSIGKAATAMGLTQPGLSRLLKKLESQVGAVLFERTVSGVLPTIAAEALLPYAEEIASDAQTAIEEIASLNGRSVSTVRVGAIASIASSVLPPVINRLLIKWPSLRVQLVEGVEDHLSDALARCEIDIAIAGRMKHNEVPFSQPDRLCATLVVIASGKHALAKIRSVGMADLLHYRWVLPPPHTLPMVEFHQRFHLKGLHPPVATVETRSISTIRALVALTDLLAWQPRALLSLDQASGSIAEVDAPDLVWRRQFFVFKRQRGILPRAANIFVEELRGLCGDTGSPPDSVETASSRCSGDPLVRDQATSSRRRGGRQS